MIPTFGVDHTLKLANGKHRAVAHEIIWPCATWFNAKKLNNLQPLDVSWQILRHLRFECSSTHTQHHAVQLQKCACRSYLYVELQTHFHWLFINQIEQSPMIWQVEVHRFSLCEHIARTPVMLKVPDIVVVRATLSVNLLYPGRSHYLNWSVSRQTRTENHIRGGVQATALLACLNEMLIGLRFVITAHRSLTV